MYNLAVAALARLIQPMALCVALLILLVTLSVSVSLFHPERARRDHARRVCGDLLRFIIDLLRSRR
jgi:hypothetical protein